MPVYALKYFHLFLILNHQDDHSRPKEAKKWIKSWKFLILKCTFRVLGNDLTLAFTKLSIISKNKNSSSSEFACPKRFVLLSCETMQNLLTGFAATTSIPRGEQEFFPHLALTFWVNPFFTWPWAKSPWFQFFRRVFGGVIRALASKTITTFWKDLFDSSKQFNFPFCDLFYYRLEPYLDLVFKKVDLKKTKRSKWWPPWTFFLQKNCVNERLKSVGKLTDSDQWKEKNFQFFVSDWFNLFMEKERKSKSVFKGGSRTEKSLLAINLWVTTPLLWNCCSTWKHSCIGL